MDPLGYCPFKDPGSKTHTMYMQVQFLEPECPNGQYLCRSFRYDLFSDYRDYNILPKKKLHGSLRVPPTASKPSKRTT